MQSDTIAACNAASSEKSMRPHHASLLLLSLLSLLALPLSASAAETKPGAGREPDKCIAGICLETPMTQEDIVAKYGPGRKYVPMIVVENESTGGKKVSKPDTDRTQRCYYDPNQHLYIEFEFDKHQQKLVTYGSDLIEITVSTVPMCAETYTPKQPFAPFKTERGVGIGATEAEVQAAMGKPDHTFDMVKSEQENLKHRTHEELVRDHDSAEYGEKSLYYNPDPQHMLLQNAFLISHGKVKSIILSNSE